LGGEGQQLAFLPLLPHYTNGQSQFANALEAAYPTSATTDHLTQDHVSM
jgi:hypothetical protein